MLKLLLFEMRPRQWLKNLVIFLPAVFANQIFTIANIPKLGSGFVIFSFVVSSLYIFNDICDRKQDSHHPEKKHRPIASGKLSVTVAFSFATMLLITCLLVGLYFSQTFFYILISYALLILIYSFKLKKIPIIDMTVIAAGFVLRIIAGAFLIQVQPSNWIIITTFFFALFFVATKRRLELKILEENATNHRAVLDHYAPTFSNILLAITASLTIASYSIYTLEESVVARLGTQALIYTVPFIFIFIARLIYLAVNDDYIDTSDPTNIILKDRVAFLSALTWIFFTSIILLINH